MSSTSRIDHTIRGAVERGEKASGIFLTSGFPDPDSTLPILRAIDRAGADFIELGMPFSDPLAEGTPIQRSSERALSHSIRMSDTLRTAEQFRRESDTPLILMGYINPIFHYGVSQFCRDARSSGVDGLIIPDLPPEEKSVLDEEAHQVGLDLIYLIAPNTSDERIQAIDRLSSGFVYAVSITGLTGSGLGSLHPVEQYLERARRLVTRNPLLVGFGIRSFEDARKLSRHTDGFIVGSALVSLVEQLWDHSGEPLDRRLEQVTGFVRELKYGREAVASVW